jgi:hypothetical protein
MNITSRALDAPTDDSNYWKIINHQDPVRNKFEFLVNLRYQSISPLIRKKLHMVQFKNQYRQSSIILIITYGSKNYSRSATHTNYD